MDTRPIVPYILHRVLITLHLHHQWLSYVCLSAAEHVCIIQWTVRQTPECVGVLNGAVPNQHHLCSCGLDQLLRVPLVLGRTQGGTHQLMAD